MRSFAACVCAKLMLTRNTEDSENESLVRYHCASFVE